LYKKQERWILVHRGRDPFCMRKKEGGLTNPT